MEDTLQHPEAYPGNCVERKRFSVCFLWLVLLYFGGIFNFELINIYLTNGF